MSRSSGVVAGISVTLFAVLVLVGGLIWWGMHQGERAAECEVGLQQNAKALDSIKQNYENTLRVQGMVEDNSKNITRQIVELERAHARQSLHRWSLFNKSSTISEDEMDEIDRKVNDE